MTSIQEAPIIHGAISVSAFTVSTVQMNDAAVASDPVRTFRRLKTTADQILSNDTVSQSLPDPNENAPVSCQAILNAGTQAAISSDNANGYHQLPPSGATIASHLSTYKPTMNLEDLTDVNVNVANPTTSGQPGFVVYDTGNEFVNYDLAQQLPHVFSFHPNPQVGDVLVYTGPSTGAGSYQSGYTWQQPSGSSGSSGSSSPFTATTTNNVTDYGLGVSPTIHYKMGIYSNAMQATLQLGRQTDGILRTLIEFYSETTNNYVGSIKIDGSQTAFSTSSDYRLKENVNYTWDATTRLKQLKPARFSYINDQTHNMVDGFLAHEVQPVVPNSVSGFHNEVDDEGNAVMQGIDHSKLVPILVKTVQELEARIAALENLQTPT